MRHLVAAALAAGPTIAQAEIPAELIAARDAAGDCTIAPGEALFGDPVPVELGGGTRLHVLPCTAAARQIVSVALIEGPSGLAPAVLAEPVLDLPEGGDGAIDWDAARVTGLRGGGATATDMVFDAETGLLLAVERMPPSMGTVFVTRGYRLETGESVLETVEIYVEGEGGSRVLELALP